MPNRMADQERTDIVEKAVDCLRIVTTGNDANKRALVEIPIAVPALVALLSDDPTQVCSCRLCNRRWPCAGTQLAPDVLKAS